MAILSLAHLYNVTKNNIVIMQRDLPKKGRTYQIAERAELSTWFASPRIHCAPGAAARRQSASGIVHFRLLWREVSKRNSPLPSALEGSQPAEESASACF